LRRRRSRSLSGALLGSEVNAKKSDTVAPTHATQRPALKQSRRPKAPACVKNSDCRVQVFFQRRRSAPNVMRPAPSRAKDDGSGVGAAGVKENQPKVEGSCAKPLPVPKVKADSLSNIGETPEKKWNI